MEIPEPFRSSKEYDNLGFIGAGANGYCFLLFKKDEKRFCILKVAEGNKLMKEGRNMSEISIPYIAKSYDYSKDKDCEESWVLIDYIPGVELNEIIPSDGVSEIKPLYFFKIAISAANTLSKLHEKNVIHRDIKPENIIIDGDFNPHIIDLGDLGETEKNMTIRITGDIHGTIPFCAPEVFFLTPDLKSDVFSLGATMFQMVTTEYPFSDLYLSKEGVQRYKEIIENNPELNDMVVIKNHIRALEGFVERFERSRNEEEREDIFYNKICDCAGKLISELVRNGCVDDRFKEGELYDKLSERNKEIMDLVYECFTYDPEVRPSAKDVANKLLEIAKTHLEEDEYNNLEEYIDEIDSADIETYGTVQNVQKAVKSHLDARSKSITKAASRCITGYQKSSESDFQKVFKPLTIIRK